MKWISIKDRLPERLDPVITLLWSSTNQKKAIANSIQLRNVPGPDGAERLLPVWAHESVAVTHWIPWPTLRG